MGKRWILLFASLSVAHPVFTKKLNPLLRETSLQVSSSCSRKRPLRRQNSGGGHPAANVRGPRLVKRYGGCGAMCFKEIEDGWYGSNGNGDTDAGVMGRGQASGPVACRTYVVTLKILMS